MYYFYVLKSHKDDRLYYGSTNDLKKRLAQHVSGKVESTSSRLPVELVYYEAYKQEVLARRREHLVKKSSTARDTIKKRIGA
jgi:putative endonuclease